MIVYPISADIIENLFYSGVVNPLNRLEPKKNCIFTKKKYIYYKNIFKQYKNLGLAVPGKIRFDIIYDDYYEDEYEYEYYNYKQKREEYNERILEYMLEGKKLNND